MSKSKQAKKNEITFPLPDGSKDSIHIDPHLLNYKPDGYATNENLMEQWFHNKFYDDVSDIRKENSYYYKHYVHNFVSAFFTRERIEGKEILDFGCGPGFYSVMFAERGAKVVGIDKSQFLITKAIENRDKHRINNLELIQADLIDYALKWESGRFDYVIAIDTIVSFDNRCQDHRHGKVVAAFCNIKRILKDDGRFYIIESHPFFGKVIHEVSSDTGQFFCIRNSGYKLQYRHVGDPHHWFTLEEMTRAVSESGLAVLRILEPDPSLELKQENPALYSFRLKYPGMIVYEIGRYDYIK